MENEAEFQGGTSLPHHTIHLKKYSHSPIFFSYNLNMIVWISVGDPKAYG